jgi:predicted acetyltransferase
MATTASALSIRVLGADDTAVLPALARLFVDAYPLLRITAADELARYAERLPQVAQETGAPWVVAERDGELVGAMRLYDYTMRVRDADAFTGGLGSLAVALAHKRRGIAKILVRWYLDHYRERGATFAILHPFRLDFYRALGFGYGTPVYRYRFAPEKLRADAARGRARILGPDDVDAVVACTERVRARTNGMIAKPRAVAERALRDAALRYVGVEDGGTLRAFMLTRVSVIADDRANRNELAVRDVHYEDPASLAALLAYLRAQRDAFAAISIESHDTALYLSATDPRDGTDLIIWTPAAHRVAETGLGMMYRIVDLDAAFAHLARPAAAFALRAEIEDAFYPQTGGPATYCFAPEAAARRDDAAAPDATLRIGIADLSSLVVGSLGLRDLVRHRLAEVEPPAALARVAELFHTDQPPVNSTYF